MSWLLDVEKLPAFCIIHTVGSLKCPGYGLHYYFCLLTLIEKVLPQMKPGIFTHLVQTLFFQAKLN